MRFTVLVEVALRPGIADPQGATIERALPALGFNQVSGVRTGKAIRFSIEAADEGTARAQVDDLCHRFLTNPVIEYAYVTLASPELTAEPTVSPARTAEAMKDPVSG